MLLSFGVQKIAKHTPKSMLAVLSQANSDPRGRNAISRISRLMIACFAHVGIGVMFWKGCIVSMFIEVRQHFD
jgi:hypothetical protein